MNKKFIQQIPFFSHLSDEKIELIMNQFKPIQFKKEQEVIQQNDKGDGMYLIIFGEVDVIRDGKKIATLKDEDFFGELALVADEPRSATIRVKSEDLSTFFLSKEAFNAIKKELDEEVKQEILRRITENYV